MVKKRIKGHRVDPMSTLTIRSIADDVRRLLHLGRGKINMSQVIELILPKFMPSFEYQIIDTLEMGEDEARTYPNQGMIKIREDVYYNLCDGDGRAQFTLAHELGHLVLHTGAQNASHFARNNHSFEHKMYEDSEWQADTFASEFLMPFENSKECNSAMEIQEKFGVSAKASEVRFAKVN